MNENDAFLKAQEESGKLIRCLDQGFVRYEDHMGDDQAIIRAARVSYGEGTKKISDDRGLIRYLMRHAHTTPFEMVEFKFHIRITMDAWRQMIRHRTANVNEYSTRYSLAIDAVQATEPEQWRLQTKSNRQGSSGLLTEWPSEDRDYQSPGHYLSHRERTLHELAREVYAERIDWGIAREQARKDLPLCNYTEAYWKIDLHNLFHFLRLRLDSHAQQEIREYANAIATLVAPVVPLAWEAFTDYVLGSIRLSRPELQLMQYAAANGPMSESDYLTKCKEFGVSKREREEFEVKAVRMGLTLPAITTGNSSSE